MRRLAIGFIGALLCLSAGIPVQADPQSQIRLADDLDRPGEGYCIDVLGVGRSARSDLPLVVHNCLPERGSVDRVAVEQDGRLVMPAFNACVTAFGVTAPLPGAAVILRPCGASESFLPAAQLQRFTRTADDQFRLAGSNLCLAVGAEAAPTFSASHRWRTLTMEPCATTPLARSAWR